MMYVHKQKVQTNREKENRGCCCCFLAKESLNDPPEESLASGVFIRREGLEASVRDMRGENMMVASSCSRRAFTLFDVAFRSRSRRRIPNDRSSTTSRLAGIGRLT